MRCKPIAYQGTCFHLDPSYQLKGNTLYEQSSNDLFTSFLFKDLVLLIIVADSSFCPFRINFKINSQYTFVKNYHLSSIFKYMRHVHKDLHFVVTTFFSIQIQTLLHACTFFSTDLLLSICNLIKIDRLTRA